MVVAPTLMGDVTIEPVKDEKDKSNFHGDRIRIYTKDAVKNRPGNLIMSDMGDLALIVSIFHVGDNPFIEARPVQYGKYRFKSLKNFHVFSNACGETSRGTLHN